MATPKISSGSGGSSRQDIQLTGSDSEVDPLDQFKDNLEKLTEAISDTRNAGALAARLKQSGGLTLFWGSVTGNNHKDLAGMVQDLGASLETTQLALGLVMKLQMRKHGVLNDFHSALVKKIEDLSKDTNTLDSNQRAVAVAVLSELNDHVLAQIRYQELVVRHEDRLDDFQEYTRTKNIQDAERDERIETLREEHIRFGDVQKQKIANLYNEQQRWVERMAQLEYQLQGFTNTRAVIMRQIIPTAALLAGVVAIALHFFQHAT